MCFPSLFTRIAGLGRPTRAIPTPVMDAEAGVLARVQPYSPILEEVGVVVGCSRLPGERDAAYAHRLGIHITEKMNELEALLKRLVDHHHRKGS